MAKFVIPMGVIVEAPSEAQAVALRGELEKLIADSDVKTALVGSAIRAGCSPVVQTHVGAPQPAR